MDEESETKGELKEVRRGGMDSGIKVAGCVKNGFMLLLGGGKGGDNRGGIGVYYNNRCRREKRKKRMGRVRKSVGKSKTNCE